MQTSLFDLENRYASLSEAGDPLERLDAWAGVRIHSHRGQVRSGQVGLDSKSACYSQPAGRQLASYS